ncbi:MAG: TPM domain-containing protein [Thermomicrobiales bacterium]
MADSLQNPSPATPAAPSRLSTGMKAGIVAALLIPLAVLGYFLVQWLVPHQGPNSLAGGTLGQPGIVTSPNGLVSPDDAVALKNITNDGSLFGMPMAIRIVRVSEPMTQPETQDAAARYFSTTPIESSTGAKNGLLFYIAVPFNQPRAATAAFVPGENFFPQNGLTQERLDRTLTEVVQPRLASGEYAEAAKMGAAWVVYDQLFGTMPRVPLSHGQEVLNHLTNRVLAPMLALLAIGYAGLAAWTRRASRRNLGRPAAPVTSAYTAAAIARGRVDDALPAATVMALFAQGNLKLDASRQNIVLGPEPDGDDAFTLAIWSRVAELAAHAGGTVPLRAVSRLDDGFERQMRQMQGILQRDGQFSSRIPWLNRVMWIVGGFFLLVIGYVLVPALVSRAAAGFLVAILALVVLIAITWWTFHRDRATSAGIVEAQRWLTATTAAAQKGDPDAIAALRVYRLILHQEAIIADRSLLVADYGSQAPQFMARIRGMSVA